MASSLGHSVAATLASGFLIGCPADLPSPSSESTEDASDAAVRADRRGTPPNVILIVVDTLRQDHLSHYGYERDTAEPLDSFREQATLFSRAYATAPWTGPSTISIHTGLSPLRHGANRHGDAVPDDALTLAERLSAAGFSTQGISFNHNVSEKTGFDQGFDEFDDFLGKSTAYPDISTMVEKVDAWLTSAPREPYFLYLHPMNTHGPYRVPRSQLTELLGRPPSFAFRYYGHPMGPIMRGGALELRDRVTPEILDSLTEQYDVAVHYSMKQIAVMLDAIERHGLLEDTLVILTSDHGEELFDHGGFSHGYTLYREVLNVPLYVRLPHQQVATTEDRLVSILDIVPTVLEVVNLPPAPELDGVSLFAPAGERPKDRTLVQQTAWKKRAEGLSLIQGNDHLIDLLQSYDKPEPVVELYDLGKDPTEQVDLSTSKTERLTELRSRLASRVERLASRKHPSAPENVLSEMDRERLRALGYVDP